MGRRREEKVDEEELARLESPEGSSGGKIRVKMPNLRVNEMFALAERTIKIGLKNFSAYNINV